MFVTQGVSWRRTLKQAWGGWGWRWGWQKASWNCTLAGVQRLCWPARESIRNACGLIPFSLIFMSLTFSLAVPRFLPPPPAAQRVFPLHPISLLFFCCFPPLDSPCSPSHNKESPESPCQRQKSQHFHRNLSLLFSRHLRRRVNSKPCWEAVLEIDQGWRNLQEAGGSHWVRPQAPVFATHSSSHTTARRNGTPWKMSTPQTKDSFSGHATAWWACQPEVLRSTMLSIPSNIR